MDDSLDSQMRLFEEYRKMRLAIAGAVMAWGDLENSLAGLLATILNTPNYQMPYAVYYAPSNTETRLSIIDNVITHLDRLSDETPRILACWDSLRTKIDRSKNTRNKIVHGNVVTMSSSGQNRCRLTSPIFDYTRRAQRELVAAAETRQFLGMSSHDVEAAAKVFSGRSKQVKALSELIIADRKAPFGPSTWRHKLVGLEADLNLTAAHKDAQTPKAQPPRPRSSPE